MNLSDIDFSAIGNMLNNLSSDEKERLNNMADEMMQRMAPAPEEEEPDVDFSEALHLDEELLNELPAKVLANLENAWDLEDFYEAVDPDADFSGSALFYTKALLELLRAKAYPVFRNVLSEEILASNPCRKSAGMTSLADYTAVVFQPQAIHALVEEGFGTEGFWDQMKTLLVTMQTILSRAEFDRLTYEDLQAAKQMLLSDEGLKLLFTTL